MKPILLLCGLLAAASAQNRDIITEATNFLSEELISLETSAVAALKRSHGTTQLAQEVNRSLADLTVSKHTLMRLTSRASVAKMMNRGRGRFPDLEKALNATRTIKKDMVVPVEKLIAQIHARDNEKKATWISKATEVRSRIAQAVSEGKRDLKTLGNQSNDTQLYMQLQQGMTMASDADKDLSKLLLGAQDVFARRFHTREYLRPLRNATNALEQYQFGPLTHFNLTVQELVRADPKGSKLKGKRLKRPNKLRKAKLRSQSSKEYDPLAAMPNDEDVEEEVERKMQLWKKCAMIHVEKEIRRLEDAVLTPAELTPANLKKLEVASKQRNKVAVAETQRDAVAGRKVVVSIQEAKELKFAKKQINQMLKNIITGMRKAPMPEVGPRLVSLPDDEGGKPTEITLPSKAFRRG